MKNINLIPIGLFLVGHDGITNDQLKHMEAEGKHVMNQFGEFLISMETNIVNDDQFAFGITAPLQCLNHLNNLDDEIEYEIESNLLDYCMDENLVDFVYFNKRDNKFYVKVIDGSITDLDTFCNRIDILNEMENDTDAVEMATLALITFLEDLRIDE